MRIPALPIVASLVLFAAPALAQNSAAAPGSPGDTSPSTSAANSAPSGPSAMNGGKLSLETQQKIRHSLEQSGFKNISVVPESFVIRAQAPDGSRIVMMTSPDVTTGIIEHSGSSSAPGMTAPSSAGGGAGGSTTH